MTPSQLIDKQIAETGGWRAEKMKQLRKLVHEADPEIQEEWKWEVGIYVHNGMICAISAFTDHVKINFFKGAKLSTQSFFNSGLDSKSHRSINFSENDSINEHTITALVKEAVVLQTK